MKKIEAVHIVGEGLFGTFLKELFLEKGIINDATSEHVILAVPFGAYEEVAQKYTGRHLINVCSVQEISNNICIQNSDQVTGIHPLFGPRSPERGRTCVLTQECDRSQGIIDLFTACGSEIITHLPDGRQIDGALHDRMMALTHGATLAMADKLSPIVDEAEWIPERCLPTSFKRVREVVRQFEDMSEGTAESIRANPYL